MNVEGPPIDNLRSVELCLGALKTVLPAGSAIYIATPITSGLRFAEWFDTKGRYLIGNAEMYVAARKANVDKINITEAEGYAAALRLSLKKPVINPGLLDAENWGQPDYRFFWRNVIENLCEALYLRDGWEYSSGASYEYLIASLKGIPRINQAGHRVPPEGAANAIANALRLLRQKNADTSFLEQVQREIVLLSGHSVALR